VGSGDTFPAPAPAAPYGGLLSDFNGFSPNGLWSLYVRDDLAGSEGGLDAGWSLLITTASSSFGFVNMTNGAAVLVLQGPPTQQFSIEASEDLTAWEVLGIVQPADGSFSFVDPAAWSHGSRFYRARPTP
jgi:hypothetical protein